MNWPMVTTQNWEKLMSNFDSNMGGKDAPQLALLFDGRAQETESVMSY